jgi:PAS domain S-box-containing protein/diguanylate cyclase (GGDEF)-like protein
MNNQLSPKNTTTLTVFMTLLITTIVVICSLFLTTELYKKTNYLGTQWHEFRNDTVIKQNLTKVLSTTFIEKGLLGEIKRYAFSPNKANETNIRSKINLYKSTISKYKRITGLSTVETRLLMSIDRELNTLKNSFFLATTFAAQNRPQAYKKISERLSAKDGEGSVDKLTAYHIIQYNTHSEHIDDTINKMVSLVIATLILLPLIVFYGVYFWISRHKVSSDILSKSNRDELDKMFRFSAIPTVIVNRSGDIVNANSSVCDLTGYSMSHLLSKHLEQLVIQAPSGLLKQIMTLTEFGRQPAASKLLTNKGCELRVEIDITQMIEGKTLLSIISFRNIEEAQQALDKSNCEQDMYNFTESLQVVGSWRWDFSDDRLMWSSKTYEFYGFNEETTEISQEILLSCIPGNEREDVSNAINETVIFGKELNISHHIEQQDGTLIFVHQHGKVVSDDAGKALYMLGSIQRADKDDETATREDVSNRVFNSSLDAMAVTNQRNKILKVNHAFLETTGFTNDEAIGQQLSSINRATFFDQCIYDKINSQVKKSHSWAGELWNVKKDGEVYPTTQHICAISHEDNQVSRYLCTFRDISEQKALEERIINSRVVDSVTMLPSRSVLQDRLIQSIKRHERDGNQSALLVISFKPLLNDEPESVHIQIIKSLAQRLIQITRDHDTIARFGRYEFAVLLEGLALGEDAYVVADKIQLTLNKPLLINQQSITAQTAIGISLHPLHATNDDSLIQYADAAMQQAKLESNSNIQIFNQHILGIYNGEQHLNTQLQRAIDLKELAVNYQPAISFKTQHIVRCIAHVRWHHRAYNTADTQKFIASAKSGKLSKPLHDWLLENSIKYATQWSNSGLNKLDLQVKIVSAQLEKPGLAQKIKDILNIYQFSPEQLILEITHEALNHEMNLANVDLAALADIGVKFLVVNVPNSSQALTQLNDNDVHQALVSQSPLSSSDISADITVTSDNVVNNMKETDIYPNNFDWQQQTFISSFQSLKTPEHNQLLICGSVDSQNLIILGNKLQNTIA